MKRLLNTCWLDGSPALYAREQAHKVFWQDANVLFADNQSMAHIGLYHFVAFWGYKSILPTWGRYATLIGGTSQILAAALTLLDRNDLHDIVDTAFPLLLIFWIALRNIMVKATPKD